MIKKDWFGLWPPSNRRISLSGTTIYTTNGLLLKNVRVIGNSNEEFVCENLLMPSRFPEKLEAATSLVGAPQTSNPATATRGTQNVSYSDFHKAVLHGNLEKVKLFIDQGGDVNAWKDASGEQVAFTEGGFALSSALTDLADSEKKTTSHLAIAEILIQAGANVNDVSVHDASVLCGACNKGQFEIANLLLENGANPNHEAYGNTPLILAAEHGDPRFVGLLLDHGADPDFVGGVHHSLVRSALDAAREKGHLAFAEALKDYVSKH